MTNKHLLLVSLLSFGVSPLAQAQIAEFSVIPIRIGVPFSPDGITDVIARFAPVVTPAPVVAKLSAVIAKAVTDPAVQARLKDLGADPFGNQRESFQKFVVQAPRWSESFFI